MDSFGTRLRHLRRTAELTQEALAEKSGLSSQAIGALERGDRRYPHRDPLDRLPPPPRLPAAPPSTGSPTPSALPATTAPSSPPRPRGPAVPLAPMPFRGSCPAESPC